MAGQSWVYCCADEGSGEAAGSLPSHYAISDSDCDVDEAFQSQPPGRQGHQEGGRGSRREGGAPANGRHEKDAALLRLF